MSEEHTKKMMKNNVTNDKTVLGIITQQQSRAYNDN